MNLSKEAKAFKREVMSATFGATILAVVIGIMVTPNVKNAIQSGRDRIGM